MNPLSVIAPPLVGAVIGYVTNYIAILKGQADPNNGCYVDAYTLNQ